MQFPGWGSVVGVVGGIATVASALLTILRWRYSRSLGRDLEGFWSYVSYVVASLWLPISVRFNEISARQLGLKRYAILSLEAFPSQLFIPSAQQERLDIDRAYVRLSMVASGRNKVPDGVLTDPGIGNALVLGEPGSGKSSLTKKLFRESCKQAYGEHGRSRLPIHIELRQLHWPAVGAMTAEQASNWLLEQVRKAVEGVPGVVRGGFVFRAFAAGPGLMVFLDGLDEVPNASLLFACDAIQSAVQELRTTSERTTVVVTARSQLRESLPRHFVNGFSRVYTLEPFSPADIFTFLRRWPFTHGHLNESNRIFSDLRSHPTLAEMCTNPLVLSMYVAHDQRYSASGSARSVRLPDTRPEFYSEITNELLLFRREEQLGRRTAGSQVKRTREMLLGRIALDHLLQADEPANSIPWPRAVATTHEVLKTEDLAAAEVELRQLAVDTGIFAEERRAESLRFMHLTLCEYLAAREVRETGEATLANLLSTVEVVGAEERSSYGRRLWEVMIFALALLGRLERETALTRLELRSAPPELLLRVIHESQAYDLAVFRRMLKSAMNDLQETPEQAWDQEWFSRARLLTSCLHDAKRVAQVRRIDDPPSVGEVLQALIRDDPGRFARVFDMYLEANPSEALRLVDDYKLGPNLLEPRRLVDAMERPDIVALAMQRVDEDTDPELTWTLALAEAALRHELVAQILRDEPCPRALREPLGDIQEIHTWRSVEAIADTFYGGTLAVATSHIGSLLKGYEAGLPRLGLLAEVPPDSPVYAPHVATSPRVVALTVVSTIPLVLLFCLFIATSGALRVAIFFLSLAFTLPVGLTIASLRTMGTPPPGWWVPFSRQLPPLLADQRAAALNLRPRPLVGLSDEEVVVLWLSDRPHLLTPKDRPEVPPQVVITVTGRRPPRPVLLTQAGTGGGTLDLLYADPLDQALRVIDLLDGLVYRQDALVKVRRGRVALARDDLQETVRLLRHPVEAVKELRASMSTARTPNNRS